MAATTPADDPAERMGGLEFETARKRNLRRNGDLSFAALDGRVDQLGGSTAVQTTLLRRSMASASLSSLPICATR